MICHSFFSLRAGSVLLPAQYLLYGASELSALGRPERVSRCQSHPSMSVPATPRKKKGVLRKEGSSSSQLVERPGTPQDRLIFKTRGLGTRLLDFSLFRLHIGSGAGKNGVPTGFREFFQDIPHA